MIMIIIKSSKEFYVKKWGRLWFSTITMEVGALLGLRIT